MSSNNLDTAGSTRQLDALMQYMNARKVDSVTRGPTWLSTGHWIPNHSATKDGRVYIPTYFDPSGVIVFRDKGVFESAIASRGGTTLEASAAITAEHKRMYEEKVRSQSVASGSAADSDSDDDLTEDICPVQ